MLKWTVHKPSGGGSPSRSVGPCYSIRRAAAKLSKHRPRRSSDRRSLNNKENHQEFGQENENRPSPRKRDSIYMCLDSLPAALRDVSNYQSLPRTPENQGKVQRRLSNSQPKPPRKKSPCSSCSPHRKEALRDRQENVGRLKRSRSATRLRPTPTLPVGMAHEQSPNGGGASRYEFSSPRKKQPCSDEHHQTLGSIFNQTFSNLSEKSAESLQIDYSPCPLATTQNLIALRQRMTDTLPLLSQGISLDNPLYYALNQSPSPSPVDLINKEIPTIHKRDALETPTNAKEIMAKFAKNLTLGLNESDEIKLTPKPNFLSSFEHNHSHWVNKEKAKTCDVSPLARRLAWLRLNTVEKNGLQDENLATLDRLSVECNARKENFTRQKTTEQQAHTSFTNESYSNKNVFRNKINNYAQMPEKSAAECSSDFFQTNSELRQRVGNIVLDYSVINILNTNHDRQRARVSLGKAPSLKACSIVNNSLSNDRMETECMSESSNAKGELTTALKRRGVVFNEQTFELNTPPASDLDERRTKTSSCCTSIDLDQPSSLKRQRAIRRRRLRSVSDDNLPLSKRVTRRHPISYLTLPKGLPSPFDVNVDDSLTETPRNTRSKSVPNFALASSRKVTFGSLYDIEYSDSGENNSPNLLGLTLPKGIPSPPSPDLEEIPGVRPLGSPKPHQTGSKRKTEAATSISDCSEETWDSHKLHYLKTPRLTENTFDDVSFVESLRTKSPSLVKNHDEEDNDDDFSSLASSVVSSPLRQSRSRRCLSFASPSKRNRSWKRILGRGELEVSLHCENKLLAVHVHRGRNLGRPGAEPCNAYIKVCLIPSGADRGFHRTCVRKYSNNPRFDHKFILQLQDEDFERRILISAWHRDRSRRYNGAKLYNPLLEPMRSGDVWTDSEKAVAELLFLQCQGVSVLHDRLRY